MHEIAVLPSRRVAGLISLALLTYLTACANGPTSKNLEQILAADPRLKGNSVAFGASNDPKAPTQTALQLPADFPTEIPRYPNAQLQEATQPTSPTGESGSQALNSVTRWVSSDPSNLIASFYRTQLQANNWELSQPDANPIEARRGDLRLTVSIQPVSAANTVGATPSPSQPNVGQNSDVATQFVIQYARNAADTQAAAPQPGDANFIGPVLPQQPTQQASTPDTNTPVAATGNSFTDINKAPQELRQYIEDLAALDVLLESSNSKSNQSTLEPNKTIDRREYARWLVAANNRFHANSPAQQIRLASQTAQPAFQDVPPQDPDFPAIQGLAEAGLIPSPLSGNSTTVLFRPDAPLTREQLLLWKVPLDTRQALPNASVDAVKQTWGFQDAPRIDPQALRAVLADFQNTDQSNIRRVFGYTTLFQPKKPVTRAEAAAALWYFGTSSEGISAKDVVNLKNQHQSSPLSQPTPSSFTNESN